MNPPMKDINLNPDKLVEEKEHVPSIRCDLCDVEIVNKIAETFLPALASACIDNTTGGLLRNPVAVAVDIRRDMVDYLTYRSENFVAETLILKSDLMAEVPENPYDVISSFVDDFVNSKRNIISRVSGWALNEKREDRIEDLIQEMEINGFWLFNRRVSVAQSVLKNIDFKNTYHCICKFKSREELEEHKSDCNFRTMACVNEGCDSTFSVGQMDHHDSICPFKILPCEQKCPDNIMRRDMDRHCITICPMKLVKCPFCSAGCQSLITQCTVGQHRLENLHSHIYYILHGFHRQTPVEDLDERVEELQKVSSPGQLASARDVVTLTNFIKDLDVKLGPIISKSIRAKYTTSITNQIDEKKSNESPIKLAMPEDSPTKKEGGIVNSPSGNNSHENSYIGKEELVELPIGFGVKSKSGIENMNGLVYVDESSKDSSHQREENSRSQEKTEVEMVKSTKEEVIDDAEEQFTSPFEQKEKIEQISEREDSESCQVKQEHVMSERKKVYFIVNGELELSPKKEHVQLENR